MCIDTDASLIFLGKDFLNALVISLFGEEGGNFIALPTKLQTSIIGVLLEFAHPTDLKRAFGGDP